MSTAPSVTAESVPSGMPTQLAVLSGGRTLQLDWDDERRHLDADALRAACRCAECMAAKHAGHDPTDHRGVRLVDVQPYGPSAVSLVFSDGHRRGLFPFAYLAALAAEAGTHDRVTA